MSNKDSKSNIHEGHRQRLKKRFLDNGLASFEPHNILELVLFYSIPRRDTNEIAHALISKFGSLKQVFDASYEELISVDGINENSATLIKLIPQLSKTYLDSEYKREVILDTAGKIGKYLVSQYIGETKEIVYLLLLDNKFGLIKKIKLHEGTINSAHFELRKIFEEIIKTNASCVVLAHNHPNGLLIPSSDDIYTTTTIYTSLKALDVSLLEHFLIVGNRYLPLIHETPSLRDLREDSILFNVADYNESKVAQNPIYSEKELEILSGKVKIDE